MVDVLKQCSACGKAKPLTGFYLRKSGLAHAWCKECTKANQKKAALRKQGRNTCRAVGCGVSPKQGDVCWNHKHRAGIDSGVVAGDNTYLGNGTIICRACGHPTRDAPHRIGWPCPLRA